MRHAGWMALALLVGCFGTGGPYDPPGTRPDARGGPDSGSSDPDAADGSDAGPDGPPPIDAPPPCVPRSCADQGASCGAGLDNGCGVALDCGTCEGAATCGGQSAPNVCAIPPAAQECANGWCWESPSPFELTPTDVFARTASDVWMVGARGVIKHFDGTAWTAMSSNTDSDLNGIWMASATDGWIVGDEGTLLRWNGAAWSKVATGTTSDLRGVHGTSANNVWIVGDGVTRRWNGSTWANVGTTTINLSHVFLTANGKVFGTAGARIYENVSGAWISRTSDTTGSLSTPYFTALVGAGTSVYGVGGVSVFGGTDYEWIWHWDGTTWTRLDDPGVGTYGDAFVDGGTIYGVKRSQIWNLATQTMVNGPASVAMKHAAGAGGEIFAPTQQGLPWHYQAGTWTTPPHSGVNTSSLSLLGVYRVGDTVWFGRNRAAIEWNSGLVVHARPDYIDSISGTGRDNVWALDRDSFQQFADIDHFDGERWRQIDGPGVRLEEIHATADEVLVIGAGVFHLDGSTWVAETPPAPAHWSAYSSLGDDVYLLGMDSTTTPATPRIARRNAGAWSTIPAPAVQKICGIAAISPTSIWVTGQDRDPDTLVYSATVSHWNGATWTITRPANTTSACAIAAHAGELWVAGTGRGTVLHRATNGTWTTLSGTASGDLRGLAVDSAGTLWAVGDDGVIMHH